jgi:hypothetical protein
MKHPATSLTSSPILSYSLAAWTPSRRKELLKQLDAGELTELEFEAVVYRRGHNHNHVIFRDEDLDALAASFVGCPFLRNHDVDDIASRDGTIIASRMDGDNMVQTIQLTTDRGIRDFLRGLIDRFSISWYWSSIQCSICGGNWQNCGHYPGRTYAAPDGTEQTCELIFLNPRGKETSAVNAPAVPDTHILSQLAQLKETLPMPTPSEILLPDGSTHPVQSPSQPQPDSEPSSAAILQEMRALETRINQRRVDEMIETSGLSEQSRSMLKIACSGRTPEEAAQLILAQRQAEAAAIDRTLIHGIKPITDRDMSTPHDRMQHAVNWIFGVRDIEPPAPHLRDIRNIYQAITGDVNWYGVFNPEWSQLAAATTTTLAGMVVDALNRVTKMHYDNMVTYRWYESIVSVTPHSGTTHDVNLVTMDGISNLPTVNEGAAYTEASVDDAKETISFSKYGAYVGITLEAIRRSDIQRIQVIPRELIKAAIRTRSAAISSLFTANAGVGPTLADDSKALFHNDHGNLTTAALADTSWAAARTKIWEQTIPGTSKPLGLWPTFCLVPIELYDTALTLFGYGSGDVGKPNTAGTAQEVNPYGMSRTGDPRPIPIAVPEWTDANNWAYLVDPRLHPVIHMAYAQNPAGGSHPMPEIFEVASETAGLMFTNDTLPVKVRDWWTYGVSTYIGIGKANVTD